MIVKQGVIVKAYKSAIDLNKQKISSGKIAKKIYELVNKLKPTYEFQLQEEEKIFEAHPNFDIRIGGIRIMNQNDPIEKEQANSEAKEIEKELNGLSNLDVDLDFDIFDIDLEAIPDLKISGEDIGNLESFINFN